ncbi:hypothetical protein [Labilithrix luteola]|uniref:hypothetical protein n=1 Tax=Labilithrix luteola TaxID=1391654 RepID=UPI0011BAB2EF|nr:hypothetical protein [Labilithrix luteola]
MAATLAAVFLFLAPAMARAASLALAPGYSGNPPSLPRIGATEGAPILEKRPAGFEPEGVSRQDCLDDQRIRFPLVLGDAAADARFEAWATTGTDCSETATRESAARTCWRVAEHIALTTNPIVDIPVRAILSGVSPNSAAAPVATADVCGKVDLTNITVQFLYFDPGAVSSPTAKLAFTIRADTIGPPAPAGVEALPGNQRLRVSWGTIGDGGLVSLRGVDVYCAEPSSNGDGGGDGGADASPNLGCAASSLAGGDGGARIPDNAFDEKFLCSMITGNTAGPVIVDRIDGQPLVNGTNYAVAVAATDVFGNIGPLSSVVCAMPEQTYDFWTDYKEAGGSAGDGGCAVGSRAMPGSFGICGASGGLAGLAVMVLRRRSRARRRIP